MKIIDLRSDTVTRPTPAMRKAMVEALLGDDVYGDDPTVNQLEAEGAKLLGKEAALFVPSGTMANQISIMVWTRPGDEIILGTNCHIVHHEAGAAGRLSGVNYALVDNQDWKVYPKDVHRLVRPAGDMHLPTTSLVCLENALGNGDVVDLELMKKVYLAAKEHGLKVHLDGARIFNAACALGVEARDIAAWSDSVSVCLSKGLASPVGTLICGPADFITQARRCRKLLGGAMRQAGVLAACGLISLSAMTQRLQDDHDNAKYLGKCLAEIPGLTVESSLIKINMVYWAVENKNFEADEFVKFLDDHGVKINPPLGPSFRLVTHVDVTKEDLDRFLQLLKEYLVGHPIDR